MMDGQEGNQTRIRITVSPEPTDEEVAAIVAVVTHLAAAQQGPEVATRLPQDAWRVAGRREALRSTAWNPGLPIK